MKVSGWSGRRGLRNSDKGRGDSGPLEVVVGVLVREVMGGIMETP